ncbi:MAG: carbohydrate ABC transporter permease [Chloroflexi bacterium]|nr:carbohydrate ABC transporter permease [Chloroflexota bacterium]
MTSALSERFETVGQARRTSGTPPFSAGHVAIYVVLTCAALLALAPFLYMLMTSLKTYGSVINNNLWPWPPFGTEPLQGQNYPDAIQATGRDAQWGTSLFVRYLANSLIVAGSVVLGTLVTSSLAAYALARMDVPGKRLIFILILVTMMVPDDLTLVPRVVLIFNLKLYNTYPALIAPFLVNAFGIFLLRQFFLQIPRELFEAAQLDGMGHLRFLASIVLPLSKPALLTIALLSFIWAWDEFRWPLLVTRDSSMRVLPVGLQQFMMGQGTEVHLLMAFAAMVIAPAVVLYFFAQRYFREGVLSVGIKG